MTEVQVTVVEDASASLLDVRSRDLKRSTTRGALISIAAQAAIFVMRTGSMLAMARLLNPKDFGLVGMVTALTGVLALFKDAGLSVASVPQADISGQPTSTFV